MNVLMYGDEEAYKQFGRESCLITLSHRGDLDWVAGYTVGAHFKILHVSEYFSHFGIADFNCKP